MTITIMTTIGLLSVHSFGGQDGRQLDFGESWLYRCGTLCQSNRMLNLNMKPGQIEMAETFVCKVRAARERFLPNCNTHNCNCCVLLWINYRMAVWALSSGEHMLANMKHISFSTRALCLSRLISCLRVHPLRKKCTFLKGGLTVFLCWWSSQTKEYVLLFRVNP